MNNTYSQVHIHVVFAVKYREALIEPSWRERLYQYIAAVINNKGHKTLAIGGTKNHIHILFGLRPHQSISSLMLMVKRDSSVWINKEHLTPKVFQWQSGFGAFTYSKSQLPGVIQYIVNQEQHHAKQTFRDEYIDILKKNKVDFDERYIFKDV